MIDEIEMFSMLLSLEQITSIYLDIGNTICTDIDFTGCSYNTRALKNSLTLLMELEIILNKDGIYYKVFEVDKKIFPLELKSFLFTKYKSIICNAILGKTQYDIEKKEIFVMRNSIPLNLAGLFMLLNDYGVTQYSNNKVIIGRELQNNLAQQDNVRKISIEDLENKLLKEKELGEIAEEYVLKYERRKLRKLGINLEPKQISLIDVAAGFDILSYFSDKLDDEKYIEVKSCDEKYTFHISENELKHAKLYGSRYYLYLYNRMEKSIKEINNPYKLFFEKSADCWVVETDGYKIHKI